MYRGRSLPINYQCVEQKSAALVGTRVGCERRLQIARHVEFEAHSAVVDLICEVGRAGLNAVLLNHPF